MKYCPKCKQRKEISSFAKNKKRYDGLQNYCRKCKVINDHQYYLQNKDKQRTRVVNYLTVNKRKMWEYLKKHSCIDCGESNPIVLEFDHIYDKKESVSYLLNTSKCSWKTLMKEIRKCEIRCANCHRIRTARQLNWYKDMSR